MTTARIEKNRGQWPAPTTQKTPYMKPVADWQRRRFFLLLRLAGYNLPEDKTLAYADLKITSTKKISFFKMNDILADLQRVADKMPAQGHAARPHAARAANAPERKSYASPDERFEDWRRLFFPENILEFGSSRGDRVISKKQQDFILRHAILIFKQPDNFRSWLTNWTGVEIITTRKIATSACRGLNAMAERDGLDPAPPAGSRNRPDWEQRQQIKNINKQEG